MNELARALAALEKANERCDAAARALADTAGKSRSEIHALHLEHKAAEATLEAAKRQVALAGVSARLGCLATPNRRRRVGHLYGFR